MINYNTDSMHTVGKTLQSNGTDMQSNLQSFWSFYQSDLSGTLHTFATSLTDFMHLCQDATKALAQNRIDIGTQLDKAATAAEQDEVQIRKMFRGRILPE